jgi:hypothetical protein
MAWMGPLLREDPHEASSQTLQQPAAQAGWEVAGPWQAWIQPPLMWTGTLSCLITLPSLTFHHNHETCMETCTASIIGIDFEGKMLMCDLDV